MPACTKISPCALAKRWGVSPDKVYAFIRSGELPAVNLSTVAGVSRPRWKIDEKDIEAFEQRRMAKPPEPTPKRRHRRRAAPVKNYFPD